MSLGIGNDAKLEVSVVGGTLKEVCLARDVTINRTATEVDASSRCDGGDKSMRPGLRSRNITTDILKDTSTTPQSEGYIILENSYKNGSAITVKHTDHDSRETAYTGYVTNFTDNEPLDDIVTTSTTILISGAPS
jgi:hypothetical protein